MGLVGTLLIHLKALTGNFESGMQRSRNQLKSFSQDVKLSNMASASFNNSLYRAAKGLFAIKTGADLASAGMSAVAGDYTKLRETLENMPFLGEGMKLSEQFYGLTWQGKQQKRELEDALGTPLLDQYISKIRDAIEIESQWSERGSNKTKAAQELRDQFHGLSLLETQYPGINGRKINNAIQDISALYDLKLNAPIKKITLALGEQYAVAGKTASQLKEYELRQAGASDAVIEGARFIMDETEAIKRQATALKEYEDKIKDLRDQLLRDRGASDFEMWQRDNPDANKDQQNFVKGLYDSIDATKKRKAQIAESARMWMDTRTPLEQHALDMAKLGKLYRDGTIDIDVYRRAVEKLAEEIDRSSFAGNAQEIGPFMSASYYQNRNAGRAMSSVASQADIYAKAGLTGGSDTSRLEKIMTENNNILKQIARGGGLN